jgi:hypothetical protein
LASGCCGKEYYTSYYPILEKPDQPALEKVEAAEFQKLSQEAQDKIVGNFTKLIKYARKMAVTIDNYNVLARERNEAFDNEKENE